MSGHHSAEDDLQLFWGDVKDWLKSLTVGRLIFVAVTICAVSTFIVFTVFEVVAYSELAREHTLSGLHGYGHIADRFITYQRALLVLLVVMTALGAPVLIHALAGDDPDDPHPHRWLENRIGASNVPRLFLVVLALGFATAFVNLARSTGAWMAGASYEWCLYTVAKSRGLKALDRYSGEIDEIAEVSIDCDNFLRDSNRKTVYGSIGIIIWTIHLGIYYYNWFKPTTRRPGNQQRSYIPLQERRA
ncbi:hypothetical protein Q8F55_001581 [Vanrija albida]|uniref:Uncharacterized protein n=1 Tax=Vanrija albida TaxID=181172 RepID=A0ABR3QH33_9TREE